MPPSATKPIGPETSIPAGASIRSRLAAMAALVLFAGAAPARTDANELQSFDGCVFVNAEWADGDSFPVKLPDGRVEVFRLYFVDCIEESASTVSDQRRLREQARYFGVEDIRTAVEYGKKATAFTAEALAEPFTVFTAFADARGRSGNPRYYAFIRTAEGQDLARLLVENGLARAFGLGRATPTGTHRDDWAAYLSDLELAAAMRRAGVWRHSDPEALVEMREREREDLRGLQAIDEAFTLRPPESPVDLNRASLEDLMRTGLRESLADAVIRERPFRSVEEIQRVRGIGPVTLEKVSPYLKVTEPVDE